VKKLSFTDKIKALFSSAKPSQEFFEDLEDTLIEGDLGVSVAEEVVKTLKESLSKGKPVDRDSLLSTTKEILKRDLKTVKVLPEKGRLNFFLVLGVNGVGKTTTIAKLADYFKKTTGIDNILFSAADTFRAAAIDQLTLHGERLGIKVISQKPGSDPGAVIYDTLESAKAKGVEIVLADTAGRMHTKTNLIKELQKLDKVIKGRIPEYHALLVLDSTTGQNGLRQAEIFAEAIRIDSVVLSKYDSASKGGIAIAVSKALGLPFSFLGTGEKIGSLAPFDPEEFLDNLLGIQ